MKTDIEIARSVKMRKITEIAEGIGIPQEEIAQYGHYMAKVPLTLINDEKQSQPLRLVSEKRLYQSDFRLVLTRLVKKPL